jgi:hypothetical protein
MGNCRFNYISYLLDNQLSSFQVNQSSMGYLNQQGIIVIMKSLIDFWTFSMSNFKWPHYEF